MSERYKFCNSCGKKLKLTENCLTCSKDMKQNKNAYMRKYQDTHKQAQKAISNKRWRVLRKLIIQRDNGICQRCLAMKGIFNSEQLQVHHIKPRNKYPQLIYEESNLITLCKTCNLELGVQEKLDFSPQNNNEIEFHL